MKKGIINILLYLFIPSFFIAIFYKYLNYSKFSYFIINLMPYLLLTLYFLFRYKDILKNDIKKINKKNLLIMFIVWIVGFLLMMLSNYIINYIIFDSGMANNELNNRELLNSYKLTYSLLMCLFIPILEEISFRLEFKKIKNNYVYLIITSLLFSLLHIISSTKLIELIYIIPYFILGLTFGLIYRKTDCLYLNIFAHILHNTVCVIIILFF